MASEHELACSHFASAWLESNRPAINLRLRTLVKRLCDPRNRRDLFRDALAEVWYLTFRRYLRMLPPYASLWTLCRIAVRVAQHERGVGSPAPSVDVRSMRAGRCKAIEPLPGGIDEVATVGRWGPAEEGAFRADLKAALANAGERVRRFIVYRSEGYARAAIRRAEGYTEHTYYKVAAAAREVLGALAGPG